MSLTFVGNLVFKNENETLLASDPCYIEGESFDPILNTIVDLQWGKGKYPVYHEEGRLILSKYQTGKIEGDFEEIGVVAVDSGQISFTLLSYLENIEWDGDNGNLSEMFDNPFPPVPTSDYASCCLATLKPPFAGLSPLHLNQKDEDRTNLREGFVAVGKTAYGDGSFRVFINTYGNMVIIETNLLENVYYRNNAD